MTRPARIALTLIRVYKIVFSPLFAGSCRYLPSCSEYARDAIAEHGALRGGWLGLRRVLRCHPWGGHGYDPVPQSLDHPVDHKITRSPVH